MANGDKISKWWPIIISIFVLVLSVGFYKGVLEGHTKDTDVHMPMVVKQDLFVPRKELEKDLNHMNEKLSNLEVGQKEQGIKIDKIHDIVIQLNRPIR